MLTVDRLLLDLDVFRLDLGLLAIFVLPRALLVAIAFLVAILVAVLVAPLATAFRPRPRAATAPAEN